ncbi:O-antigen translocase [Mesorhizobium sp. L-8-10]|nr:O-antigen translocase [Mesorhizobium sp. L-8-10]
MTAVLDGRSAELQDNMDENSEAAGAKAADSYMQILKSTIVMGGSSVVNVAFSVIRNKAVAVMLGPDGVGLMGLYNTITDTVQTLAGMGVQASGVRQVAEAVGSGDADRIGRMVTVLRRVSLVLGIVGMGLLAAFSLPIAQFTFGDHTHAVALALLSVSVFLRLVSGGQTALIHGLRRISDLAWISMLGAFASTVICIPLIYFFREEGIVPSLIGIAIATLATSWWYSRKIQIPAAEASLKEMGQETGALLKLGFAFMASAFLTVAAAYAIRIIILRLGGIEAAGLYQAAWALGGLYAGFILQAMGTDFYPRLTAVSSIDSECNRLVNEQAQISILLAGPGLIATLTLAPVLMTVFYSSEFQAAVELLRWICLGMMLRIVSWPMGFIILAKGAQKILFWTEVAATVVHVGLAWLLVELFGLAGAGAAFTGLYVWHAMLTYVIVRRLSGFRWSGANLTIGLVFLAAAMAVFLACLVLSLPEAIAVGLLASLASGLWSLRRLLKLIPRERLPFGRLIPRWI